MKRYFFLIAIIALPFIISASVAADNMAELFSQDSIELLSSQKVFVGKANRSSDRAIVDEVKAYLISKGISLYETPTEAEIGVTVRTEVVTQERERRNENLLRISIKAVDRESKKIEFISATELVTEKRKTKSGLSFKWYEPVIVTLAVASLIFGLWSLD